MRFLFSGDIRHPVIVAVEAQDHAQAIRVIRAAEERGNLEDANISVFDENSEQHLAAFDWDGDEEAEVVMEDRPRLVLMANRRF